MKQLNANIFDDIPEQLPEELFEPLLQHKHVHIERIVSKGHRTEKDAWYDQRRAEWVLLLQGRATLRFKDSPDTIEMKPGDYRLIPAHVLHRVEWTDPDTHTVWLAIHYE